MARAYTKMPMLDRFMRKVRKTESCWLWVGATARNGYGKFSVDNKNSLAHRASYHMFKGDIPGDREINHVCKNRGCVNPAHLETVTRSENINWSIESYRAGQQARRRR